jgi:hypothetical protein
MGENVQLCPWPDAEVESVSGPQGGVYVNDDRIDSGASV